MALSTQLGPEQMELAGEVYDMYVAPGGKRSWKTELVGGQPGDDSQVKAAPIELFGGFGATRRYLRSIGIPSDATQHAYAQNVSAEHEGLVYPAPRLTYLDISTGAPKRGAFRVGGYADSRVGSGTAGVGAVGGGTPRDTPQAVSEFGGMLYVHCGAYTAVIDPSQTPPVLVETRFHGSSARARSSDVFGPALCVALGEGQVADIATAPYTANGATSWTPGPLALNVFKSGVAGRLFAAVRNLVYNVLPGQDPTVSANYLPSAGQVLTDASQPIRSLEEYSSALVAGTARSVRTADPSRGYQGVNLISDTRLSVSDYDGRAMIAVGARLFYATRRGVTLFEPGSLPRAAGLELLTNNDTPYVAPDWGVPDFMGEKIAWPCYFPETGDSVVFFANVRDVQTFSVQILKRGTGPVKWDDVLYLPGVEARTAHYWGGSATQGPRLFIGAGSAANPMQVAWCDLGIGGGPDPFTTTGQPALTGFIEAALDDLGMAGVPKVAERIEIPELDNADASNYVVASVKSDRDGAWTAFVRSQSGTDQSHMTSAGFQRVFPPKASPVSGPMLAVRFDFTQASAATLFLLLFGTPMLYYSEVPLNVLRIQVVFDAHTTELHVARATADRLEALSDGAHVLARYGPDGVDRYVRVADVNVTELEDDAGNATDRLGIAVTLREVPLDAAA